jgi:flagellar biosynthesis regulator FlaF
MSHVQLFENRVDTVCDYYTNLEYYKDINNIYFEELKECLEIVKNYIIRNKKILVGGMAIDYALKKKGGFLYSTNKIDYDFISDEYHADAYNIGNELAKKFDDISIIVARHTSTLRVRYKFMAVADITHMPKNIHDRIETIDYEGFRIISPNLQMADQMRALSHIVENPPQETYFGDRLLKDIKRFNLLAEKYPPVGEYTDILVERRIPIEYLKNNCLGGIAASAYWATKLSIDTKMYLTASGQHVTVNIPENARISIYCDEPEELLDRMKVTEYKTYNAVLDKIPIKYECEKDGIVYEIFHNKGTIFVADKLPFGHVSGLLHTMLYLITSQLLLDQQYQVTNQLWNAIIEDFKSELKLFPVKVELYGAYNWSEAYLLSIKKAKKQATNLLPRNAYPKKGEKVSDDYYLFDLTKSEILCNNGLLSDAELNSA